tara:strand:+ start:5533 stop:6102 length:570 start_codon:yes stop_codon:yes gene_type:complete
MATTLEILNGISHAIARINYDGALNEDGEPIEIGLKREEGDPLVDSRVIDGFGIKFHGQNKLCITYSSEIKLKEVYGGGLENEVGSMISDVAAFLKKEYRGLTGSSLSLTSEGEVEVLVQPISRIRTSVTAYQVFKIGGIDAPEEHEAVRPETTKYLEQGGDAKKSQNDKAPKDDFEVFKAYNFSNRKR